MAKVLVTGASGFIGFHVVRALVQNGHDVTCLARRQSNFDRLAGLDFRRADGDVRDAEALQRAVAGQDVVYHIAGIVKAATTELLNEVHCEGTGNLARACAALGSPPTLLLTSSLAAAGPSKNDRPRVETDPPDPVSNYGRSKLAGELEARKYADTVPITIVRPPIVFGEGDQATLEMFRPVVRAGIYFVPSWRTHRASLLHGEDLAVAMLRAAECGQRIVREPPDAMESARGCYFLADERIVTFPEVGRMMGAALGRKWTFVLPLSPPGVWTVGLCAEAYSKLIGRPWYFGMDKAREANAGSWTCSPAAAKRDLQFVVVKPLEERLRQTADWYREQGWL
jgi:nucleoside-diphosphate-sugar epimerase